LEQVNHDEARQVARAGLSIDSEAYVLTIEPGGFKLVLKGHREGLQLTWRDLVTGEAALAIALNASPEAATFRAGDERLSGLPANDPFRPKSSRM
jgi:hypothetical protein